MWDFPLRRFAPALPVPGADSPLRRCAPALPLTGADSPLRRCAPVLPLTGASQGCRAYAYSSRSVLSPLPRPREGGRSARKTLQWSVFSEAGPVRARWDPMRQHWARAFGRPPEEVPEGRRGGYPIPQLSVMSQKVAATLDTPPPMLYNGIAIGKHPRCSSATTARNASEQVATAGGISHLTLKAEVNRQRETCNSNQSKE